MPTNELIHECGNPHIHVTVNISAHPFPSARLPENSWHWQVYTIVTKFCVFLFTENCALLFTDYSSKLSICQSFV